MFHLRVLCIERQLVFKRFHFNGSFVCRLCSVRAYIHYQDLMAFRNTAVAFAVPSYCVCLCVCVLYTFLFRHFLHYAWNCAHSFLKYSVYVCFAVIDAALLLPHPNNAPNILEYHNCRFSFQKPRILCKEREKNRIAVVVKENYRLV